MGEGGRAVVTQICRKCNNNKTQQENNILKANEELCCLVI